MTSIKYGIPAKENVFDTATLDIAALPKNACHLHIAPASFPLLRPRCIESTRFAQHQHQALIGIDRYGDCLVHAFNALDPENSNYRIIAGKPYLQNTIPSPLFWRRRYATPAGASISQAGLHPPVKYSVLVDPHHTVYVHEAHVAHSLYDTLHRLNTLCPQQMGPIAQIDIAGNGRFIAILHANGALYRHDRLHDAVESVPIPQGDRIATLAISDDGTLYASSTTHIYCFNMHGAVDSYVQPGGNAPHLLGLSADERFLITARYTTSSCKHWAEILIQDRQYPECAFMVASKFACIPISTEEQRPPLPCSIAFSKNLAYIALAYAQGGVEIFDFHAGHTMSLATQQNTKLYKSANPLLCLASTYKPLNSLTCFRVKLPCSPPLSGLLPLNFSHDVDQLHLVCIREDRTLQLATFALHLPA